MNTADDGDGVWGDYLDATAQSFTDITSTTAYTFADVDADDLNGIKGVEVAYSDTHKLWAEVVNGGAVNFYKVGQNHGSPDVGFLGASTWSTVSLNTAAAIEIVVIPEVLEFDDLAGEGNIILGLIEGYIRKADIEGHDDGLNTPELSLLNATAAAAVIGSNFSLTNQTAFVSDSLTGAFSIVFTDGTATYTFTDASNGNVLFPGEASTESFTWSIDEEGRLILILAGGDTDRYTLLSGTVESGVIQLEIKDDGAADTWSRD